VALSIAMSVAGEFRDRGVLRGGVLILAPATALEMIARTEELGVPVLGVDGFWITESTTQPDLGHSIDLGSGRPASWVDAAQFVRDRASLGLMFEVVADEDTSDLRDSPA
jgi:hypothetical protein